LLFSTHNLDAGYEEIKLTLKPADRIRSLSAHAETLAVCVSHSPEAAEFSCLLLRDSEPPKTIANATCAVFTEKGNLVVTTYSLNDHLKMFSADGEIMSKMTLSLPGADDVGIDKYRLFSAAELPGGSFVVFGAFYQSEYEKGGEVVDENVIGDTIMFWVPKTDTFSEGLKL
jgi:hypothetical protein